MEKTPKESVTGLDHAADRQSAELDLVSTLLEMAQYPTAGDAVTEAVVKRHGVEKFTVHLHPLSDEDIRRARRKATTYAKNPNGKHLPPIERETNNVQFKSHVIFAATTPEDQKRIWGQQAVLDRFSLMEPWESIDVILTAGEKAQLFDTVINLSGLGDSDEQMSVEEYAKN